MGRPFAVCASPIRPAVALAAGVAVLVAGAVVAVAPQADGAAARPTVTSVSPSSGATTARQQIVVSGNGFGKGSSVYVGGRRAAAVDVLSSHTIIAYAPPQTHGSRDVTVRSGGATSHHAKAAHYSYVHAYVPTSRLTPRPAPLPSDRSGYHLDQEEALGGFSCGTPQHCVAVGTYDAKSGSGSRSESRAMALAVMPHRTTVTAVPAPADSLTLASCSGPTFCAAIGVDADFEPVLATLRSGKWTSRRLPAPTGSGSAGFQVSLGGISCGAPTHCVVTASAPSGPYVYILSGTTVSAHAVPLPANASSRPNVDPGPVSCASAGWCAFVGSYSGSSERTMGVTLVNGTPHTVEIFGPTHATGPGVEDLVCPAVAHCYAAGYYRSSGFGVQGDILTLGAQGWGALAVPSPADADKSGTMIEGIACPQVTTCFGAGDYETRGRSDEGVVVRLVGTTVSAQTAPDPVGTAIKGEPAILNDVACHSSTSCVAVGSVGDSIFSDTWTKAGVWVPANLGVQPGAAKDTEATDYSVASPSYGTYLASGDASYDFDYDGDPNDSRALYAVGRRHS